MKYKMLQKAAALLALAAVLLCGCGKREASAVSELPAAAGNGLRLTQSEAVNSTAYEKEAAYADFLAAAKPAFLIPGLEEGCVPQGMGLCAAKGRLYISNYFTADGMPSVITALDAQSGTLKAEYFLYQPGGAAFDSHVGGVAVSDTTLYVSAKLDNDGGYSIAAIPLESLAESGSQNVSVETIIQLPVSPSFLNYSDGVLWVGNFYHPDKDYGLSPAMNFTTAAADGDYGCYILGYRLGEDAAARMQPAAGAAYPIPDYVLAAPDRIQGMTLTEDGRAVLSQSYGRKNDSTLLGYTLDLTKTPALTAEVGGQQVPCWVLDSTCQNMSLTAMPMTEALSLAPDGGVYVLFESGAMHYSDGKNRTDRIWELTLPNA